MKFLHEYLEYPNGKVIDNGYWEICGKRLYNRRGGFHKYVPQEGDEIIESTWPEIIRKSLMDKMDDSMITGWIAPDGTFFGCSSQDHADFAEYVLGHDEFTLEKNGYCKIFENPVRLRIEDPDLLQYSYYCRFLTSAQQDVLEQKGIMI